MTLGIEWLRRLEPLPPYGDLQRGFATEVADPLWMLGRQWRLGEHAGEDAGAPVAVRMTVAHTPIESVDGLDPTVVPIEAIIEGTAADWWTPGRRIRIGRAVAGSLTAAQRKKCRFKKPLPTPYDDDFKGEVDGLAGWRRGLVPEDHPLLADLPAELRDSWDPHTLDHDLTLSAGSATLTVSHHTGGDVDWYTVDGDRPLVTVPDHPSSEVVPVRLQYPGAPLPRVFQIEDHAVDIGGYPPDRSHLATALLIELVSSHSSDWFLAPVPAPYGASSAPGTGAVVTLSNVIVRNTFDEEHQVFVPTGTPPPPADPDLPIGPWSLFRTTGLDDSSLVVWPVALPVTGPLLDEVAFGVDEDANLMWAVEMRVDGRELNVGVDAVQALADAARSGTREFSWQPSTTLPPSWFPYKTVAALAGPARQVFEQGRVADLNQAQERVRPGPASELIAATPGSASHVLETQAVPYQGLRLERRYQLARGTDGRPVLWRQRRTVPLLAGPTSHLRFDLFKEAPDE